MCFGSQNVVLLWLNFELKLQLFSSTNHTVSLSTVLLFCSYWPYFPTFSLQVISFFVALKQPRHPGDVAEMIPPFLGVDEDAVASRLDAFSDARILLLVSCHGLSVDWNRLWAVTSLLFFMSWQNRFPFCLDASCCVEYATAHSHIRFLDIRKHDGIVGWVNGGSIKYQANQMFDKFGSFLPCSSADFQFWRVKACQSPSLAMAKLPAFTRPVKEALLVFSWIAEAESAFSKGVLSWQIYCKMSDPCGSLQHDDCMMQSDAAVHSCHSRPMVRCVPMQRPKKPPSRYYPSGFRLSVDQRQWRPDPLHARKCMDVVTT